MFTRRGFLAAFSAAAAGFSVSFSSAAAPKANALAADTAPISLRTMGSFFFGGTVAKLENGETFHGDHGYAQYYIAENSDCDVARHRSIREDLRIDAGRTRRLSGAFAEA